jgi:16S rRNA (adenine1518-N6/adenine1519-N6)-dimethyltransferase
VASVRRELGKLNIPPLKRFGQNFLIDGRVREQLIDAGRIGASDTVLEIGPGLGFLTSVLAERAGHVIAFEKDRTLAANLRDKFSRLSNVTVIQGNVLEDEVPDFTKIVSSPPYNISSKLTLMILKHDFEVAALLLQLEFAQRLNAIGGSRNYGRLTVMFQSCAEAKIVSEVSPSAFYPRPKVNSAIVTIKRREIKPSIRDQELFTIMVRSLFTQRRRRLNGVLIRYLRAQFPSQWSEILKEVSVPEKRVFEMTPSELVNLSNQISMITESKSEGDSVGN